MKRTNLNALKKFSQYFGLHPLVGFGMFATDLMKFGVEAGTFEIGWLIAAPLEAPVLHIVLPQDAMTVQCKSGGTGEKSEWSTPNVALVLRFAQRFYPAFVEGE